MSYQAMLQAEHVPNPDFVEVFSVGADTLNTDVPNDVIIREEPNILPGGYGATMQYAESMALTAAKLYVYNKIVAQALEEAKRFQTVPVFDDDYLPIPASMKKSGIILCSTYESLKIRSSTLVAGRMFPSTHQALEGKTVVLMLEAHGPLATYSWGPCADDRPLPEKTKLQRELRLSLNLKSTQGILYERVPTI